VAWDSTTVLGLSEAGVQTYKAHLVGPDFQTGWTMKQKHTPGPWIYRWSKDANGFLVGTETGPGEHNWPGNQVGVYTADVLREADARLIAAAPDLFEAIQRALKEIEMWDGEISIGVIEDMQAALAKVMGGD
jgi:hypothetical protein